MIELLKKWYKSFKEKRIIKKEKELADCKQAIIRMVIEKERMIDERVLPKEDIDTIYRNLERCHGEGLALNLISVYGRSGVEYYAMTAVYDIIDAVEKEIGREVSDKKEVIKGLSKL